MSKSSVSSDRFEDLGHRSLQHQPFVYRKQDTLSLHFDFRAVQSEMRHDAPHELALGYTRTMMGFLLFKPQPEKIVMIGLGGGSMPKYCYARLPEAAIVVVEINPGVIALRDEFHVPKDDERFQVVCQDGADFVRTRLLECDVLVVDGFDKTGQPPQLCSQRFYEDCYDTLTPGGILAVNLHGNDDACFEASVSSLHRSFDGAVIVLDSEDSDNKIAFASKGKALSVSDEQLSVSLERLKSHHSASLRRTLQRICYKQYRSLVTTS